MRKNLQKFLENFEKIAKISKTAVGRNFCESCAKMMKILKKLRENNENWEKFANVVTKLREKLRDSYAKVVRKLRENDEKLINFKAFEALSFHLPALSFYIAHKGNSQES